MMLSAVQRKLLWYLVHHPYPHAYISIQADWTLKKQFPLYPSWFLSGPHTPDRPRVVAWTTVKMLVKSKLIMRQSQSDIYLVTDKAFDALEQTAIDG